MDMKRLDIVKILMAAATAGLATLPATAENKVERSPLQIGTALDLGQVVSGVNMVSVPETKIEGMMIQRTAVYLNQTTTVDDRLIIKVGVGGLFFYGFPELKDNAQSRSIRFGPGVGQAYGLYKFGDPENSPMELRFGYFPYKYNPDAKNLGEYLFRSGAYPGYEMTGGWSLVNSALYMGSGLSAGASMLDGTLKADFNVFLEHDVEPIYDISPGIVITYKPTPAFEIGAGAAFSHLIPVNPSKIKSKNYLFRGDSLYNYLGVGGDDTLPADPYTFAGTKLMARASFSVGALLDNPWIGQDGLKLYGEAALLGLKDYPYFYEDKMARMPLLMGFNLPTFKFFDVLAVEMEYRKNQFPNSTFKLAEANNPVWRIPDVRIRMADGSIVPISNPHLYHPNLSPAAAAAAAQKYIDSGVLGFTGTLVDPAETAPSTEGNLKWTLYAKKQLVSGVFAYIQVASDHLRAIRYEDNTLDREIITQKPKDWYYLFRLEFGI
jgi:hypothetical protein